MTQAKADELRRMAAARYGVLESELPIGPAYNTAPRDPVPVVFRAGGAFRGALMEWGPLKDGLGRVTIARSDSLLGKRMFRDSAQRRRCLILADGFFEFEAAGRARIPHRFVLRDRGPFVFAALYEPPSKDQPLGSCLVVTTEPNELVGRIHHRMPLILPEAVSKEWAGAEPLTPERAAAWCRPYPAELMEGYRVNAKAAHSGYKEPDAIDPWRPPAGELPLGV